MAELLSMQQDRQVRQEVLDPSRSFIVQAPAGSGKTELLTQRILRLLAHVEQPENIVAITFTRKAAGEMRARLLQALRKAASSPCPETPHLAQSWQLAQAVLEQDRQHGWQLMDNPGRLEIRTMDSFNARLVRQMPLLSSFGALPAVTDDAEVLYQAAARATLQMVEESGLGDAVATLLRWLDNDAQRVERLVTAMLGHRDQWLPHVAAGTLQRGQLEQTLQHAVESVLLPLQDELEQQLGEAGIERLLAVVAAAATELEQTVKESPLHCCLQLARLPGTSSEALQQWQAIASLLLTQKGEFRLTPRSWDKRNGFPANDAGRANKAEMLGFSQQLSEGRVARLIQKLPELPPLKYEEAQWEVVDALFQVLLLAQASLMVEFEARGVVDHVEIAQRALQALGSEAEPTALGLRLDYQIHHLLVDEFQDTSHGQFELLSRLTAEWVGDSSRSLFLVGDPMQSIYRFRHAEVGLFIRAIEQGVGTLPLEYRRLSANFRSEAGVVEWVNGAFSKLFPQSPDRFSGAISYAPSIATRPPSSQQAVEIHPQLEDDREAEAALVGELIERALSEMNGEGRVAILVRSRPHLLQITEWLYRQGVRYRAVEIESLGERPQVRDLLILCRALLHQGDREAWLALLRGPWCGISLQGLLQLVEGAPKQTLWALLQDEARLQRLERSEYEHLQRLQNQLQTIFEQRGNGSLLHWVERAWIQLGGAACYHHLGEPGQSQREQQAFFDLLRQLEQPGQIIDFVRLQQRLQQQNLRPGEAAGEPPRVEVMTIHKSKGLQFDSVILPALGRKPRNVDSRLLHWLEVPGEEEAETMQLLLSPIRATAQRLEEDLLGRYVRKVEQEREWNELTRLLYVAITRAERKVHLLGACHLNSKGELAKPASRSLLEQLWPQLQPHYQQLLQQSDVAALQARQQQDTLFVAPQAKRLRQSWQPPQSPAPVLSLYPPVPLSGVYQWGGSSAVHIGTVVHAQLQWIAEQGVEQWSEQGLGSLQLRAQQQLRQLGVAAEDRQRASERVVEAVRKTIEDPQGYYLLQQHQAARSEWSLSALLEGELVHVTIDRTFIDADGVRWIVDWKSSSHQGGGLEAFLQQEVARYTPQLQRYGAVLAQLESRPQRRVLYFPMHQQMCEVV